MTRSILKFKLGEKYFAIPTYPIKKILQGQNVLPLENFPSYVLGTIIVQNEVYPLICLKNLIKHKPCKQIHNKPIIILNFLHREYAFLLDEIIELDEVGVKYKEGFNLYEKNKQMYQELSLETIFKKIDIPDFQISAPKFSEKKESDVAKTTFLIFSLGSTYYAINDELIYSIGFTKNIKIEDENEQAIVGIHKNRPIKFLDLAKKFSINSKRNAFFIIRNQNQELAFFFEDIVGLQAIENSFISKEHNNEHFSGYFLFNKVLVSILSQEFLEQKILQSGLTICKEDKKERIQHNTQDFLLVQIFEQKYAVPIVNIIGILDYLKTEIQKRPGTMGNGNLILYKNHTVDLLDWQKLQKEFKPSVDAKIVIIQQNSNYSAIAVDKIEDIITVPEERIAYLPNEESMSAGILITPKGNFNIFNINWRAFRH